MEPRGTNPRNAARGGGARLSGNTRECTLLTKPEELIIFSFDQMNE